MKKFGLLFASALALLTLASCSDETEIYPEREDKQDEEAYAAQATVSSSDVNFTTTGNGGTIQFKTEGGSVTLNVSCGCEWLAENSATDLFSTSLTSSTLTVTAVQNTVEEDLTGTITLMTENYRIVFATITVNQTAYGAPTISVETNEWSVPAVGALTTDIAVEASEEWTAEAADIWLTIEKTDTGMTLTAAENEDTKERSTKITLACTDGIRTAYDYITVSQDAAAYITFSKQSISLSNEAGSESVTVESNYNWDYSYDTSNEWFTITRDGDILTATAIANETSGDREGTVIVTAGDGAENVTEEQLIVTQAGSTALILTYTITSANTSTKLPLNGTVDCTVDWGDGSEIQSIKNSIYPSHTYAEAGEYDVIISGTVTFLYSSDISSSKSPLPITAVKQWGNTGLVDMQYAFYYCTGLVSLPEYTGDAFANVTSFYGTFGYCSSLTEIPTGIFDNCPEVTDFSHVFNTCSSLKTIPAGLFDKCTKVTDFKSGFYNCSKITEVPAGLFDSWSVVNDMSYIFYGCSALTTIPAGLFDKCYEATDFSYDFYHCTALKSIPTEGIFGNCTKVENFKYIFDGCTALTEIPAGLFDNCAKVTNFSMAFYGCTKLETIPSGLFDKFTDVETFQATFYNCSSLKKIPDGLFDHCSSATTFNSVFYGCKALTAIPNGLFNACTAVTSFYDAFYNCSGVTSIPSGLFDYCPEVTDISYTFYGCSSLTTIPDKLFDNCPLVKDFRDLFYNCSSITKIPDGLFDKNPAVTTFAYVFYKCTSIAEIPEGLFDNCPEVTAFNCAFYGCTNLTSISPSIFSKNLKVTNFQNTFRNDEGLTGESPYDLIDGVKVHLYERADYPEIYSKPSTTSNCFTGCTGLSDYDDIPDGWK